MRSCNTEDKTRSESERERRRGGGGVAYLTVLCHTTGKLVVLLKF